MGSNQFKEENKNHKHKCARYATWPARNWALGPWTAQSPRAITLTSPYSKSYSSLQLLVFNLEGSGYPWILKRAPGLVCPAETGLLLLSSQTLYPPAAAAAAAAVPFFLPSLPTPTIVLVSWLFRNHEFWLSQRMVWRAQDVKGIRS